MSDTADSVSSNQTPGDWRINLLLFGVTLVSVFAVGREMSIGAELVPEGEASLLAGWPFAVPFLLILLFHEFGHWLAARAHRVPASLPYFLPMPFVLFGTFGAVITMPERIRSRNALLDIGASGPLAGMLVAIPAMIVGLQLSDVRPITASLHPGEQVLQEGQSLLYWAIKRVVLGPMPDGHDVWLHPTAFAAWGGLFVTMINLVPWGQLDGGHIAFALLGKRHHRIATWVRASLLVFFAYNVWLFASPVLAGTTSEGLFWIFNNSFFWLAWFIITGIMGRLTGKEHPPFEAGRLSGGRQLVAVGSLLLFIALFMPTPISIR